MLKIRPHSKTAGIAAVALVAGTLIGVVASPATVVGPPDIYLDPGEQVIVHAATPAIVPTDSPVPSDSPASSITLPPSPSPSPTPVPQVVQIAGISTTMATIQGWAADQSVDVIEFATGTHAAFDLRLRQSRTRPLLFRCQPSTILSGTGASLGAFHLGTLVGSPGSPTSATSNMTFDLTGCTIQNYTLGADGLMMTGWVQNITFKNVKVRSVTGSATLSHIFYVESDQAHHGSDVTIENFDVIGPTNKAMGSGVQIYAHDTPTGTNNVKILGGTWSNLNRFTYAYSDATGFLMDGVNITNVNVPIEAPNLAPLNRIAGIVKNSHATGSGANRWDSTLLIDGGGNSWN